MAALTSAQSTLYFATEGKKANPLSPLDWLAQQAVPAAKTAVAPVTTVKTTAPATTVDQTAIKAKIQDVTSQISDLQAKETALSKYGLSNAQQLAKDASGNYVPKVDTTSEPVTAKKTAATKVTVPTVEPTEADTSRTDALIAALQKISGTSNTDAVSQLADIIAKAYTPTATETSLQGQVDETTKLIDNLESNLNSRINSVTAAGGEGLTSAQASRQYASEQAPLAKTLAEESAALSTARAGRTALQGQIPALTALAEYQSPQQQLAQILAQYQGEQDISESTKEQELAAEAQYKTTDTTSKAAATAADTSPKVYGSASTGYFTINDDGTLNWLATKKTPKTTTETTKPATTTYTKVIDALSNVRIPTSVASKTSVGSMTNTYLDKLVKNGVPADTAQGIWDEILNGTTLEEIRQYFRDKGVDPKVLDKFMMTLQGLM